MPTFTCQPNFAHGDSPQPDLHPTAMSYDIDMAYEYIKDLGFALIAQGLEVAVIKKTEA